MNPQQLPILLLFDVSALMETTAREWQEFERVGTCYIPQVVYEEIQFLCDRASEPQLEKPARDFIRFQVQHNWQITNTSAPHPALAPPKGQALSKKARLALMTAQCAYGLAQEQAGNLVVFVSNTQPLLQRLQVLKAPNLCGITSAMLLQWSRTKQRPAAIAQQLQVLMRQLASPSSAKIPSDSNGHSGGSLGPIVVPRQPASRSVVPPTQQAIGTTSPQKVKSSIPRTAGLSSTPKNPPSIGRMGRSASGWMAQTISGALALAVLTGVGLFVWRTVQPRSFNQFWNTQVKPALQRLQK